MRAPSFLAVAAISIVTTSGLTSLAAQDLAPPTARIIPKIDTLHGEVRTDNYFWIRNKSDPQVMAPGKSKTWACTPPSTNW